MKRQVPGLAETVRDARPEIPDGIFLVRVDGAQFRWHAHKTVLCPSAFDPRTSDSGRTIHRRSSLLQPESDVEARLVPAGLSSMTRNSFAHEQVDEKALPGLRGVVKISHCRDQRHFADQS